MLFIAESATGFPLNDTGAELHFPPNADPLFLLTWVGFPQFYHSIPQVVSHAARFVFMQLRI